MSGIMEQLAESRAKNGNRGSTNNKQRLEAFAAARNGNAADWSGCQAQSIQDVVTGVTELGGAVTIGLSKDGGAHSMTLLLDGQRKTLWFNADADLDAELSEVSRILEAIR